MPERKKILITLFSVAMLLGFVAGAQLPVLGLPEGHRAEVYHPVYSPDGRLLVTVSADKTARVWEVLTGRLLFTLSGHTNSVFKALFTPDGRTIITSGDVTIRTWDAATGKPIARFVHGAVPAVDYEHLAGQTIYSTSISSIDLSRDGRFLVSGSLDSTAILWDLRSGKWLRTMRHEDKVQQVAFSKDGSKLFTLTKDGRLHQWQPATGKYLGPLLPRLSGTERFMLREENDALLAVADRGGNFALGRISTGAVTSFSHGSILRGIAWSADGKRSLRRAAIPSLSGMPLPEKRRPPYSSRVGSTTSTSMARASAC